MWTGFQKPKRLAIEGDGITSTYGRFNAQPFERGFGTTIGNSLRRALLSSIEGAAITAVRIEGISHEFSPIPGVVEDATDIILNLKRIPMKLHGEGARTIRLRATEAGPVDSGAIEADSEVEILDLSLYLATVNEGGMLDVEMRVKPGRGYVSAEKNFDEDLALGYIPIDSVHSPVRKVKYSVEAARLGQMTDYDKLMMEVWTNGAISPQDAIGLAAKLLKDHMTIFINFEEEAAAEEAAARGHHRPVSGVPQPLGRGAGTQCSLLQLLEERQHPDDRRPRCAHRVRYAQDEEFRAQVIERDQGDPVLDESFAGYAF